MYFHARAPRRAPRQRNYVVDRRLHVERFTLALSWSRGAGPRLEDGRALVSGPPQPDPAQFHPSLEVRATADLGGLRPGHERVVALEAWGARSRLGTAGRWPSSCFSGAPKVGIRSGLRRWEPLRARHAEPDLAAVRSRWPAVRVPAERADLGLHAAAGRCCRPLDALERDDRDPPHHSQSQR